MKQLSTLLERLHFARLIVRILLPIHAKED